MRRYIRCELSRQIYSMGLMLWSGGQYLTNFSRCRLCLCILCQFNSRPVGLLSESATGCYLVLSSLANNLSSLQFVVFNFVLRFVAVPGSHSKCAGLPRLAETVSTLPFIMIFMTLPFLTMTLYGPS